MLFRSGAHYKTAPAGTVGKVRSWRTTSATTGTTSIRAQALGALVAHIGGAGNAFTYAQALAAFATLAQAGANNLGCSTPAARFTKFVRSGHIAVQPA